MLSPPPHSTLFPYTTLFRSNVRQGFEMLVLRMLAFRPVSQAPADLDLTSSLQKKKLIEQPTAELNTKAEVADEPNVEDETAQDRKSTRLNSSHVRISYAVFC